MFIMGNEGWIEDDDAHRLANAEPSEQPADAPFEGDGDE
jgi:hypothetical protein